MPSTVDQSRHGSVTTDNITRHSPERGIVAQTVRGDLFFSPHASATWRKVFCTPPRSRGLGARCAACTPPERLGNRSSG